jgi:hypothetical protein
MIPSFDMDKTLREIAEGQANVFARANGIPEPFRKDILTDAVMDDIRRDCEADARRDRIEDARLAKAREEGDEPFEGEGDE